MSEATKPCPVCKGRRFDLLLSRAKSAVLQNRTFASEAQARAAISGSLAIVRCRDCGFIHNRAFDPAIVDYAEDYENDQGYSPHFRAHMAELAGYIRGAITGTMPVSVIDIGCGQGGFLNLLVHELKDMHVQGFGFDAAYRGPAQDVSGAHYYRGYFGAETAHLIQNEEVILLTRHVIEHVPEPLQFLADIRAAIQSDWRARLFVETPCVEWIFRNFAVQDFFHEHCNYWTAVSLAEAAERAGFSVAHVRHVFDGQYLWMEAVPKREDRRPADRSDARESGEALSHAYLVHENATIAAWRACATAAAARGPVALWGAGAKGVTMATLIDPERETIDCLIDINVRKQSRYIPITAHPVVSPDTARMRGVRTAMVMNRNYLPEIRRILMAESIDFNLIDETMVRM